MTQWEQERAERQKWLDGLKVGDRFALSQDRGVYGQGEYLLGTIKHITPKRNRFDIDFDRGWGIKSVNGDGYETGGKGGFYRRAFIEPITDKITLFNRGLHLNERLEKLVKTLDGRGIRNDLTHDQIERIISILEETPREQAKKATS